MDVFTIVPFKFCTPDQKLGDFLKLGFCVTLRESFFEVRLDMGELCPVSGPQVSPESTLKMVEMGPTDIQC